MKKCLFLVILVLYLSLLAPLSVRAQVDGMPDSNWVPRYVAIPLGDFRGRDINNRGQVIGVTADGRPAIWYQGQVTVVTTAPGISKVLSIIDINDRGTLLVRGVDSLMKETLFYLVFPNGSTKKVSYLLTDPQGLNSLNAVFGECYNPYNQSQRGVIAWQNGQEDFVTNPDQGYCTLTDINIVGQVTGFLWGMGDGEHPFVRSRWGWQDLQTPDGEGRPAAINDLGWTVGYYAPFDGYDKYGLPISSDRHFPVIWNRNGQMFPLSELQGKASDINRRGDVLGHVEPETEPYQVVLWRNGAPALPLESCVYPRLRILSTPLRMNDLGQILCSGFRQGSSDYGYFLLQPVGGRR